MNEHERDVTIEALSAAISGVHEVLTAGNVNWSEDERTHLDVAMHLCIQARKGLLLVEA